MIVMSFRWTPPTYGWFVTIASPGPSRSTPKVRNAFGTSSTIEPRCTGWLKLCATARSWLSKKAQEKSARVLMFVE